MQNVQLNYVWKIRKHKMTTKPIKSVTFRNIMKEEKGRGGQEVTIFCEKSSSPYVTLRSLDTFSNLDFPAIHGKLLIFHATMKRIMVNKLYKMGTNVQPCRSSPRVLRSFSFSLAIFSFWRIFQLSCSSAFPYCTPTKTHKFL